MDFTGDMFGFLAAHPLTPLVSLHHLDLVDPIFPNMSSVEAVKRLYDSAKCDPHRILQQTVCYDEWFSWTVSVSWGYAVQVFRKNVKLPHTLRAQETFQPFRKGNNLYNFDIRIPHTDKCLRPAVFFVDKVFNNGDGTNSTYRKMGQEHCKVEMASPRKLEEIRVFSPKYELDMKQVIPT